MAQLAEITGDEGIDWRNVGCGNSYMLACEHDQEMFKIVFGEDGYGAVFGEAAIKEGLADGNYGLQNLGVGELAPFAARFPFGYADFVGRDFCPVDEAIGKNLGVGAQWFVGADEDRAIGEGMRGCAGSAQADWADAIVYLRLGGHFTSLHFAA